MWNIKPLHPSLRFYGSLTERETFEGHATDLLTTLRIFRIPCFVYATRFDSASIRLLDLFTRENRYPGVGTCQLVAYCWNVLSLKRPIRNSSFSLSDLHVTRSNFFRLNFETSSTKIYQWFHHMREYFSLTFRYSYNESLPQQAG